MEGAGPARPWVKEGPMLERGVNCLTGAHPEVHTEGGGEPLTASAGAEANIPQNPILIIEAPLFSMFRVLKFKVQG